MSETQKKARALLTYATPGPWFSQQEIAIFPNAYVVDCPESTVIARVSRSSEQCMVAPKRARPEHDAALIAAAPGLLAALCDELDAAERRAEEAEAQVLASQTVIREIRETCCAALGDGLETIVTTGVVRILRDRLHAAEAKVARLEARKAELCGCVRFGDPEAEYIDQKCEGCHGSGAVIVEDGK